MKPPHIILLCVVALASGVSVYEYGRAVARRSGGIVRVLSQTHSSNRTVTVFGYRENGSNVVLWTSEAAQ